MDGWKGQDQMEGPPFIPLEWAGQICAAWGVPPVEPDIGWDSPDDARRQGLDRVDSPAGEAVSGLALERHLRRELGLDCRTGLQRRGCGELVARLLENLDQEEQGEQGSRPR